MTGTMNESRISTALGILDAVEDILTVKRVFGDPYQLDGVTLIPVASLRGGGGGGGGGGEGSDPASHGTGSGAGMGFGVLARPLGVNVKDTNVQWGPAIDVMRLALGCQFAAVVALLTFGRIRTHRRRAHD
jgi:uncharacterized spore protein YtfJ